MNKPLFVVLLLFVGIAMMAATGNVEGSATTTATTTTTTAIPVTAQNTEKNEQSGGGENGADPLFGESQYDVKKDSLFGNVYDMFRKLTTYQSFYYNQYVDSIALEKRLTNIK